MRTVLRELIAIISLPLLYGVLCLPMTSLLLAQYPNEVNRFGGTQNTGLVIAIECLQLISLIICGFAARMIAGASSRLRLIQLGMTLEMLAIAVWVELQYWDAMPIWHHFVFFALIILGLAMGSALVDRWQPARS